MVSNDIETEARITFDFITDIITSQFAPAYLNSQIATEKIITSQLWSCYSVPSDKDRHFADVKNLVEIE